MWPRMASVSVQRNVLNLAGRRGGRCQQQCEQYSPAPCRHARIVATIERRDQASARAPRFKFCCNGATGAAPDRCQHDTGGDQRDADRVVEVERLAEEQHREDAAEHRHQMPGLSRARRADQFDAAIEEQIGDERREHRDVGHGEPGRQAALDAAALRDLPQIERQDHHRADAHRGDQEAHRMRRGTHAEHRGVDAVDHHRDQDPDIAAVERAGAAASRASRAPRSPRRRSGTAGRRPIATASDAHRTARTPRR